MGERLVVRAYGSNKPEWPSISFSVRRPSRRPIGVDQPPTCPLAVSDGRRYWWVRWAGVSVGAWPLLALTITNVSTQVVHSFLLRFETHDKGPSSGVGAQPEGGLLPGAAIAHENHETGAVSRSAGVDFVQFVNGETWYSGHPNSLVTEVGVNAGRRAAGLHLQRVVQHSGAAAVMGALPRIHADVMEPVASQIPASRGFYNGVTNLAVRVQHAFDLAGHEGVEALLRSDYTSD